MPAINLNLLDDEYESTHTRQRRRPHSKARKGQDLNLERLERQLESEMIAKQSRTKTPAARNSQKVAKRATPAVNDPTDVTVKHMIEAPVPDEAASETPIAATPATSTETTTMQDKQPTEQDNQSEVQQPKEDPVKDQPTEQAKADESAAEAPGEGQPTAEEVKKESVEATILDMMDTFLQNFSDKSQDWTFLTCADKPFMQKVKGKFMDLAGLVDPEPSFALGAAMISDTKLPAFIRKSVVPAYFLYLSKKLTDLKVNLQDDGTVIEGMSSKGKMSLTVAHDEEGNIRLMAVFEEPGAIDLMARKFKIENFLDLGIDEFLALVAEMTCNTAFRMAARLAKDAIIQTSNEVVG